MKSEHHELVIRRVKAFFLQQDGKSISGCGGNTTWSIQIKRFLSLEWGGDVTIFIIGKFSFKTTENGEIRGDSVLQEQVVTDEGSLDIPLFTILVSKDFKPKFQSTFPCVNCSSLIVALEECIRTGVVRIN